MRILYISHSNANDGSNVALMNVIKGMMVRGHEVAVVTSAVDGPMLEKMSSLGIQYSKVNTFLTIYPINKTPFLYIPRLLYTIYRQYLGRKAVEKMIYTFKPDIVHTNVGPLGIGYEACRRMGIPHVWHQREYLDKIGMTFYPTNKAFARMIRSRWNHNICITNGVFEHLGLSKEKDTVIYDGIFDTGSVVSIPQRDPQDVVLFVGRVEKTKGVYELIEAFNLFHKRHPEYCLHIIGNTPIDSKEYHTLCQRSVDRYGLNKCIKFMGRQDNVFEYMAKAKMLVMSSEFEGFGFVTAEAMACGCPVIGRNTTGTKEQFDNGIRFTGHEIGLRYNTTDELAIAMEAIATNDTSDMTARAKETVFGLYSIENNVTSIENLYEKIMNEQHHI